MSTGILPMPPQSSPAPSRWPHVALMAIAAIECLDGVSGLSALPLLAEADDPAPAAWALGAGFVIRLVLAVAALAFAIRGNLRVAIVGLAAIMLTTWLTSALPSLATSGLNAEGFGGVLEIAQVVMLPVIAILATTLAVRNVRLEVAAILVALPTLATMAGVLAFAVGLGFHGF